MLKARHFSLTLFAAFRHIPYFCNVFFMVLDLRLTKIGCRETINFFIYTIP